MKRIIYLLILSYNISITAQENKIIKYDFQDKDGYICNSSLYIVNNESIFKVEDTRKDGIQEGQTKDNRFIVIMNDSISKIIYTKDNQSTIRIPLYKNEVIYSVSNSKNNFEFTGQTKLFDKFKCQEAKLSINERKYTIWFTPDVEINYGPFKINGLPGLVVEVYEETNKTKITLKSIEKLTNTKEFEKYKNYILTKPCLDYETYEKNITNIICKNKAKKIAKIREAGGEIEFNESQESFTKSLIDIPTNLVSELKKIN